MNIEINDVNAEAFASAIEHLARLGVDSLSVFSATRQGEGPWLVAYVYANGRRHLRSTVGTWQGASLDAQATNLAWELEGFAVDADVDEADTEIYLLLPTGVTSADAVARLATPSRPHAFVEFLPDNAVVVRYDTDAESKAALVQEAAWYVATMLEPSRPATLDTCVSLLEAGRMYAHEALMEAAAVLPPGWHAFTLRSPGQEIFLCAVCRETYASDGADGVCRSLAAVAAERRA